MTQPHGDPLPRQSRAAARPASPHIDSDEISGKQIELVRRKGAHMEHRVELIKKLEALRGSTVITYITSTRQHADSRIAEDQVRPMIDQMRAPPRSLLACNW